MIRLTDVAIKQGDFRMAGVSFEVPTGCYAVLMGKTGCGKTSLLESICGLRRVAAGRIELGGRDVTQTVPALRGIGYVPQDAALFPHMTVEDQVGFALRIRKVASDVIHRRVRELAELLEIGPLLTRFPAGLSGGESQRVALGRALAFAPRFLLLDEPLGALDETTRQHLVEVLNRVHQQTRVTAIHVTHNGAEAASLADLLLELREGHISCHRGGRDVGLDATGQPGPATGPRRV